MYANELQHFGVKGMKWGVRRRAKKVKKARRKLERAIKDEDQHSDYKKAHEIDSVKTLSDSELRSRLNRLQMEQQYTKLKYGDIERGSGFVSNSLKNAKTLSEAMNTAINMYNNYHKIKSIMGNLGKKK